MLSSPSGGSTPSRTSSARASSIPLRFRRVALRDSDEFGLVQIEIRLRSTPTPTPPPSAVVIYIPRPPRRAAHLGETTSRFYSAAARIPPRVAIPRPPRARLRVRPRPLRPRPSHRLPPLSRRANVVVVRGGAAGTFPSRAFAGADRRTSRRSRSPTTPRRGARDYVSRESRASRRSRRRRPRPRPRRRRWRALTGGSRRRSRRVARRDRGVPAANTRGRGARGANPIRVVVASRRRRARPLGRTRRARRRGRDFRGMGARREWRRARRRRSRATRARARPRRTRANDDPTRKSRRTREDARAGRTRGRRSSPRAPRDEASSRRTSRRPRRDARLHEPRAVLDATLASTPARVAVPGGAS